LPANRHALIRYKTIDRCLQNRRRKWTLEDLIEKVSDALYEYEGLTNPISKRTIQLDLQNMRSDKLGYNAPIIVNEKKYYTYEVAQYSITNIPLTDQDLDKLGEAIEFLKQFNGFSHFKELTGMVQKLEDHIVSAQKKQHPIIDFETNPNLRGIEYLDPIYQAILQKQVMQVNYKSFKARDVDQFYFHAYLLKEYNNRWFLVGRRSSNADILVLALDRIEAITTAIEHKYIASKEFNAETYFKDVIGVTAMLGQLAEKIVVKLDLKNAPYVETKPLHASQKIIERTKGGVVFEINVKINFELERLLLGFGESLEVISPRRLRNRIQKKLFAAYKNYECTE
jgi:predicted DNA-binding transcriptional regulator YafY